PALNEIQGIRCPKPEGAFYAFPDLRGCLRGRISSAEFVNQLLEREHTVATDGAAFGADGFIRISYATSMEQLRKGVERIRKVVKPKKLPRKGPSARAKPEKPQWPKINNLV